jgi:hypothetical protein
MRFEACCQFDNCSIQINTKSRGRPALFHGIIDLPLIRPHNNTRVFSHPNQWNASAAPNSNIAHSRKLQGSLAGLTQDVPTKEAERAIVRPVQDADAFRAGLNDAGSPMIRHEALSH